MRKFFVLVISTALLTFFSVSVSAASEKQFYEDIQGKWSGPGEIVAGKYKGTRFNCTFDGLTPQKIVGMSIDGSCRVGLFTQIMNASVTRQAGSYTGRFLDGEAGDGMDITGGRFSRSRLIVDIRRKDLVGVMVASLAKKDTLNITISVRVESRLIPVIGMTLDRIGPASDATITSSIK